MFNKAFIFIALLLVNSWAGPLDEVVFDGIENEFVNGVKPSEAAKNAARSTIADSICGALAGKLGKEYRDCGIHYVPHKLMHAAIGGTFAKIQGKDIKAGALAGFAESAAEAYRNANPDKFGDGAEAVDLITYNKASAFATELGSLAAASMAAVLGLDAAVAAESGANAVRNNAVGLLITAGITAWTAYEVYEAYQEGGAEAAGRKLVEIGVITAVGGVAGIGVKAGFKVAGKIFPTAAAAFNSVAGQILTKVETGFSKFGTKAQAKVKGWLRDNSLNWPKPVGAQMSKLTKVNSINEFFRTAQGSILEKAAEKTSRTFQGQSIYKLNKNIKLKDGNMIKKGDRFYLDNLHKDHIEVFNKNGQSKFAVSLSGEILKHIKGRRIKY